MRIGIVLDEPAQVLDASGVQAAELWQREVEARGGVEIAGSRYALEISVEPTDNTPEGSARAALALINQHGVDALVGPNASRSAIPVAELAQSKGIPVISPASSHPETTWDKPFAFRLAFTDPFLGAALARFAYEDLGGRRAAMLFEISNPYASSVTRSFSETFQQLGGTVVRAETYLAGAVDFQDPIQRIVDAGPEVLFLPNPNPEVVQQTRQLRELDEDIVFLGSDLWNTSSLLGETALVGTYVGQFWHRDLEHQNPQTRSFVDAFSESYGKPPSESAPLVFDCVGLLLHAMETAVSPEPQAIRDALAEIEDYAGATGRLTFRGTHGDPKRSLVIVRMDEDSVEYYKSVGGDL